MSRVAIEMEIADGVTVRVDLEGAKGIPARALQNMAGMLQDALSTVAHHAELEVEALASQATSSQPVAMAYQDGPASPGVQRAGEELGQYLRSQASLTGSMPALRPQVPAYEQPTEAQGVCRECDWMKEGNSPSAISSLAVQHADGIGHEVRLRVVYPDGAHQDYPITPSVERAAGGGVDPFRSTYGPELARGNEEG